jgi:serine/threonine protein kinase
LAFVPVKSFSDHSFALVSHGFAYLGPPAYTQESLETPIFGFGIMSDPRQSSDPLEPVEKLGPVTIRRHLGRRAGAEFYRGETSSGNQSLVMRWAAGGLPGEAVPALAHLIDNLQDTPVQGLARVVHGSVAADEAFVAFAEPMGTPLNTLIEKHVLTPMEAIDGALSLIDALARAKELGIVVGRWDPSTLYVNADPHQWSIATPGVHALEHLGDSLSPSSTGETALCAPEFFRRHAPLDNEIAERGEIYALASSLFLAVAGHLPHDADDVEKYRVKQTDEPIRPPQEVAAYLEQFEVLTASLQKSLSLDPEHRPLSLAEFREELLLARADAERVLSEFTFLPARFSETNDLHLSFLRNRVMGTGLSGNRALQVLALLVLVAILLFVLGRTTRGNVLDVKQYLPHKAGVIEAPGVTSRAATVKNRTRLPIP